MISYSYVGGAMTMLRLGELKDLKAPQKLLLLILSSYADEHGECWPSQSTLADLAGMTRQSVNSNIKILVEKGYLVSNQQARKDSGQTSNLYQVKVNKLPPQAPRRQKVVHIHQTTEEKLTDRSWDDGLEIPLDA